MPRKTVSASPTPPVRRRVFFLIKVFVLLHIIAITSWSLPNAPSTDFAQLRQIVAHGDPSFAPANASGLQKIRAAIVPRLQAAGRIVSDGTLYENQVYVKDSPAKFYLLFTGFWQYWDMFSPNPASIDFYGTALVCYKDGTAKNYQFPRMYTMGIPKKYVSERYRKFYERAHTEDDSWIWPIFAQRVALINDYDPNNPPVKIVLTRHWYQIAPPEDYEYQTLLNQWHSAHPNQQLDSATDASLHSHAYTISEHNPTDDDYHHYNYFVYTVDQTQLAKDKAAGVLG